ncbi:trihelix transcription factor asil1 [Phtheirospermum japonicum]|uniref:Trihelix transcription factor asil1 n=1 Tax=Phtheirospermum japonicum TaxID=374723 RepID=A0A830CN53_9LAMI|nr:trihelix transcription factor asil1 [Phtheirospermum japonicum]
MDDEDDVTYHSNPYSVNRQNHPIENLSYPQSDDDDDDDDDKAIDNEPDADDDDDDDDDGNGVQRIRNDDYEYDGGENDDYNDLQRHPKKKKLKTLISSYEFAPRVPADWTEHETLILLDAWGERFLKQGRKSLRSEEWQEVSEKVSQESKIERTDTQCRNRLDTLKKKYKKEKMKLVDNINNKWVYFKKMDALLSSPSNRAGLSCGLDSGEFVFMNPKDYLNRSNGLDEMRDSPGNSESTEGEQDEPPKTGLVRPMKKKNGKNKSFKLLADSFRKFSDIYEKIEHSKRQQMVELERMRMDFYRDLELQKRQILERAQAEIARIRQGDDDDNVVVSAENVSG